MAELAPLVSIEGLRHHYGDGGGFRLDVAEFSIAQGERVALTGPSGSGKTTLLCAIAGILVPAAGSVRVHGAEISALDDAARRRFRIGSIGFVFQEFELLEHLSVRENVLLPYFVNPWLRADASVEARLAELLRATGIEGLRARKPNRLSQGERQRVALCRALITQPALVLADEPTGNLDAATAARVIDLMLSEAKSRATTLLCVTHDREVARRFDRAVDLPALAGADA